ncbi:macro domain-containing protein [Actinomyces viscosus]|uniref:macro domain-containing protein n=1 Tax=Actinomyces viscosus TaxID=1656 RepID=UPI0028E30ACC|nr:macro domain-containing protein [Actinomyces viscosus]
MPKAQQLLEAISAAGPGLRQECADIMAARDRPEPTGTATVTGGYHLPADQVIHTVGPIVQGEPTADQEALLAASYRSCLRAAEDLGASSIALCCISTGVLGCPKAEAATVAVRTVRDLLPHCQSLTKVVFNVFDPTDESIYRSLLGPDR